MSVTTPPEATRSGEALDDRCVFQAMQPGVLTIGAAASRRQARQALSATGLHALMVLASDGEPLGWVTRKDLDLVGPRSTAGVGSLVSEEVTAIDPGTPLRSALYALSLAGVSRLLVRHRGDRAGVGVLTLEDF